MNKGISVGYICALDPRNRLSWSGSHYNMLGMLKEQFQNVVVLGPVSLPLWIRVIMHFIDAVHRLLFWRKYNKAHSIIRSKYYAWVFSRRMKNKKIDILFAPAASPEIACLKTSLPICFYSDTSYAHVKDYNPIYHEFSRLSQYESCILERKAINKSKTLIFTTGWAADFVKKHYIKSGADVFIVKFGSNMDCPEVIDRNNIPERGPVKLLFVGVDWIRKGGYLAYETMMCLLNEGLDVELTVCGCTPPLSHPRMTVYPFLDKHNKTERKLLGRLFSDCHLFILPTRAECSGIVFAEAASFGVPVIATETGGVSDVVDNHNTGYLLSLSATARDYADKVKYLINNPSVYKEMSKKARERYERELNWNIWGNRVKRIISTHTLNNQ